MYCSAQILNQIIFISVNLYYSTGGSDMQFSVILGNLGSTKDWFLSSGYKASPTDVD
jgi:hypothetical protein